MSRRRPIFSVGRRHIGGVLAPRTQSRPRSLLRASGRQSHRRRSGRIPGVSRCLQRLLARVFRPDRRADQRYPPEQYRLETIILPLIDNSIYSGLATALGGRPESLDALPVPHRNIFSVNFRFDKEGLAEKAGWKKPEPDSRSEKEAGNFIARGKSVNNLQKIALGLHSLHQVEEHFPAHARYDNAGKPLLSWRVMLLPYVGEPAAFTTSFISTNRGTASTTRNSSIVCRLSCTSR